MHKFIRGALRLVTHGRTWRRLGAAFVALALMLGLGATLVSPAASAEAPAQSERKHTGDVSVTAGCNSQTGNYDFTAKLMLSRVPSGNTGSTMWRLGTSNFEGTPNSAAGMDRGPIASNGNQTIELGSWSLPGTTTGYGPWVYAYTKWSPDNFGKGSDGQLKQPLNGDCEQPVATCEKTSPTYVWGPNVVSITGGKPGIWLSLWDAQDLANQTLLGKVRVDDACKATLTVPPTECEPHQYQGDASSTEPPATITDTNGDGVADIPGYIAGGSFTVPADSSSQNCSPPVHQKRVRGAVKHLDKCGTKADSYRSKASRGVVYTVKGHIIRKGVWLKAHNKRVVVKVHAASKHFKLVGKDKWVFRYSTKPCHTPPHNPPHTGLPRLMV